MLRDYLNLLKQIAHALVDAANEAPHDDERRRLKQLSQTVWNMRHDAMDRTD